MSSQELHLDKPTMILLQGLEHDCLKNINLEIKTGEIYSIIGKTDSGKSELLRFINSITQPTIGKITLDNQNLATMLEQDFNNVRRKIALIAKNPQFITTKNLFYNVAIPLLLQFDLPEKQIHQTIEPILHFVGITEHFLAFPNQLNLLQKQLINIARALVTKPKILLCEDLTYHLDVKSTYHIINLLKNINKEFDMTMIIITNEIEVIKSLSHKVGIMDKGTIIEESSAYEIFARPQTEFAKELVRSASKHEMPLVYRKKIRFQSTKNQHPIIRISFTATLVIEHLLGHLIQAYQFKINIIQAYQERIQHHPINVILAEVEGPHEEFQDLLADAILFLNKHELHVEILGYVANFSER